MSKIKQIAKKMGGSAFLALEVIQYYPDVSVAMVGIPLDQLLFVLRLILPRPSPSTRY
jgi:hypothetical protein